jgi:hypothetical protein
MQRTRKMARAARLTKANESRKYYYISFIGGCRGIWCHACRQGERARMGADGKVRTRRSFGSSCSTRASGGHEAYATWAYSAVDMRRPKGRRSLEIIERTLLRSTPYTSILRRALCGGISQPWSGSPAPPARHTCQRPNAYRIPSRRLSAN